VHFAAPYASDGDIAFVRDLYRGLIERVGEPDGVGQRLEALSAGERALYTLMTAADMVGSGGFEQFFYSAPKLAAAAPESAQLITARRLQAVLGRANAVAFGAGPAKRRGSEFRRMLRVIESESERLARLDDEFDAIVADRSARAEAFLVRYVEYVPQDFAAGTHTPQRASRGPGNNSPRTTPR
jgi:hypothetical protein